MGNYSISAQVECPFYIEQKEGKSYKVYITCEGFANAKYNTIRFSELQDRSEYMERYCNHFPNDCPIAKLIGLKYLD